MQDGEKPQVEGVPRSAFMASGRRGSKRDSSLKTRFSDNNQVILIPRANPMVTFAISTSSMQQFVRNTVQKITLALDRMRAVPEVDMRSLVKNWDPSKDPIPVERAAMLHAFLHSQGNHDSTPQQFREALMESSKVLINLEQALSKEQDDHPFIDNLPLYRKEVGKLIDLGSSTLNTIISDVVYFKLARMNRTGKLFHLQSSDVFLDLLLALHSLRIPEPVEDHYRLYEVLSTKNLNSLLSELESQHPQSKAAGSGKQESWLRNTTSMIGYPDVQGASLLLAAHQMGRAAAFEHLLFQLESDSLNQLTIDMLVSIAKVEKGNLTKKRILELLLDYQWSRIGFEPLALYNSIPEGVTEFAILTTNKLTSNKQQSNIKTSKSQQDVLIEITTTLGTNPSFNSRTSCYLLTVADNESTNGSTFASQGSGARFYRRSKNDFFYLVEDMASIPFFSVLVSQTSALLASPKFTVNNTFLLEVIQKEVGTGSPPRTGQTQKQLSSKQEVAQLDLASGNNFLGIPVHKQIGQTKCRKFRYNYSAMIPTRKIDETQTKVNYRSFDEWYDGRNKRSDFPEALFTILRAMPESQAEKRYVELVEAFTNCKKPTKTIGAEDADHVLGYAKSLHERLARTVPMSPSLWVSNEPVSQLTSEEQKFPWTAFKLLVGLAASQDTELFPLLAMVSSGKLEGLGSYPILGIKFKTDKEERIICERILHQEGTMLPNFVELKSKIQGSISQAAQSHFGSSGNGLKFPYGNIDPRPKPTVHGLQTQLEHPQSLPKKPEAVNVDSFSDVPEDLFQDHCEVLLTDGPRFVRRGSSFRLIGSSDAGDSSRNRTDTEMGTDESLRNSEQRINSKLDLDQKETNSTVGMPSTASTGGQHLVGTLQPEVSSFNISSKSDVVLSETLAHRPPEFTIATRMKTKLRTATFEEPNT